MRDLDHRVRRSYYKLGTSAITFEKLYTSVEMNYHVAPPQQVINFLYEKMKRMEEKKYAEHCLSQLRNLTPFEVMIEVEGSYEKISNLKSDELQEILREHNRKNITQSYLIDLKKSYLQLCQHYQLAKTKYHTNLKEAVYYSEARNAVLHGDARIDPCFDEYFGSISLLRRYPRLGRPRSPRDLRLQTPLRAHAAPAAAALQPRLAAGHRAGGDHRLPQRHGHRPALALPDQRAVRRAENPHPPVGPHELHDVRVLQRRLLREGPGLLRVLQRQDDFLDAAELGVLHQQVHSSDLLQPAHAHLRVQPVHRENFFLPRNPRSPRASATCA